MDGKLQEKKRSEGPRVNGTLIDGLQRMDESASEDIHFLR